MEVAKIYDKIAIDFSHTRYSVWPSVKAFVDDLPSNQLIGDIGCGNGKNMLYRTSDTHYLGVDISQEMVKICKSRGLDVLHGNITNIPILTAQLDGVMSIAVIHHLADRNARILAISELARITRKGGKILLYVWALRQPEDSKRQFTSPDEMVSFKNRDGSVYYRYYHLYIDNELDNEVAEVASLTICKLWYEKGNYVCIAEKNT